MHSCLAIIGDIFKNMSKATKRKHVAREVLEDYYIPEGEEEIVKIISGRGNNLHEVENAFGKHYLVSMPTKFRRNIWVKRGDYVVTVPIKEGNKVQGEIVYILLAKQIKYLKDENLWPKEYSAEQKKLPKSEAQGAPVNGNYENYSDGDSESTGDELFENPNHHHICYADDSGEESSEYEDKTDDNDQEEHEESQIGLGEEVEKICIK